MKGYIVGATCMQCTRKYPIAPLGAEEIYCTVCGLTKAIWLVYYPGGADK
jgi:hypothetical protein